jgi:2,4-dienoyl-CoA reductase-like NADH-dependent reductase (Old Yellow Enzyme family)
MTDLSPLWEPITIGSLQLRNRIAAGPSTLLYARDNVVSDRHVAYHAERARGGTGLIITEEHAAYAGGLGAFPDACTAYEARAIPALARLADAVHEHGAACFVQLYGPGASDSGVVVGDRWQPVRSASHVPSPGAGRVPHALDAGEIAEVIAGHAVSASHVARAGLDGIELHAAHGWLAAQFLSPLYNRRTDEYGGTALKRCRFVLELLDAVRTAEPGLVLGVQLSVDEHLGPHGIQPEECLEQIDVLCASGLVDYIGLSTGSQFSTPRTIAAMEAPDALLAPHGRDAVRVVAGRAVVMLVDTIRTVANAAEVLATGAADVAVMTRAHFADPFLVRKAMEGRVAETVPCVGENECMIRAFSGRPVACLMNPSMGREQRWGSTVPDSVRRPSTVAVVGGGPAGLHAAATLARRGHRVVLWERRSRLGGHIASLARLPGRARWSIALDAWIDAAQRAGVDIRAGQLADRGALRGYDRVLCATGASWLRTGASAFRPDPSPVAGVDAPHVIDIGAATERALDDPTSLGGHVAVIDETGEYLPLGLADVLSSAGARVHLISPHHEVGGYVLQAQDGTEVLARLAERRVDMLTGMMLAAVEGRRLLLTEMWSQRRRELGPVDTVVLSQLRASEDALARELHAGGTSAQVLGDALAPRRTIEVIYEAERVARELDGPRDTQRIEGGAK